MNKITQLEQVKYNKCWIPSLLSGMPPVNYTIFNSV